MGPRQPSPEPQQDRPGKNSWPWHTPTRSQGFMEASGARIPGVQPPNAKMEQLPEVDEYRDPARFNPAAWHWELHDDVSSSLRPHMLLGQHRSLQAAVQGLSQAAASRVAPLRHIYTTWRNAQVPLAFLHQVKELTCLMVAGCMRSAIAREMQDMHACCWCPAHHQNCMNILECLRGMGPGSAV